MERAVGDMEETREGDTHILIPDKENREKTTKTGNAGKLLIILGLVTFLVSVSMAPPDLVMYPFIRQLVTIATTRPWVRAAPAYGIVTGLYLTLLGALLLLQLPERKELEIVVNGRQVTKVSAVRCSAVQVASALPLRAVAFTVTNLAFSIAGILVVVRSRCQCFQYTLCRAWWAQGAAGRRGTSWVLCSACWWLAAPSSPGSPPG